MVKNNLNNFFAKQFDVVIPGDRFRASIKNLDVSFKSKGHFLIDCVFSDGEIFRITIKPFNPFQNG